MNICALITLLLITITFNVKADARDDYFNKICLPNIAEAITDDMQLTHYRVNSLWSFPSEWRVEYTVFGKKVTPWGEESKFEGEYSCAINKSDYELVGVYKSSSDPLLTNIINKESNGERIK